MTIELKIGVQFTYQQYFPIWQLSHTFMSTHLDLPHDLRELVDPQYRSLRRTASIADALMVFGHEPSAAAVDEIYDWADFDRCIEVGMRMDDVEKSLRRDFSD